MGEEENIVEVKAKLIDILAKQGFSFIVMGVCMFGLWSMVTESKEDTRLELKDIREQVKSCRDDNVQILKETVQENTQAMIELKNELKDLER